MYHENFPNFLGRFHTRWKELYGRGRAQKNNWLLASYCRSGTRRSIAVAEIISFIFSVHENFGVAETQHLSMAKWKRRTCLALRGGCLECTAINNNEKQHALRRALQLWQLLEQKDRIGTV